MTDSPSPEETHPKGHWLQLSAALQLAENGQGRMLHEDDSRWFDTYQVRRVT